MNKFLWRMFRGSLPLIITLFAGYMVVRWLIIRFQKIVDWFRSKANLKNQDKNNVAFTLKGNIEQGNYVIYQGIFDPINEELLDGQKIVSEEMDSQVSQLHRNEELVVYQ